jgi:hypothetical protein
LSQPRLSIIFFATSDSRETEFRLYDWQISSRYERMKAELRETRAAARRPSRGLPRRIARYEVSNINGSPQSECSVSMR